MYFLFLKENDKKNGKDTRPTTIIFSCLDLLYAAEAIKPLVEILKPLFNTKCNSPLNVSERNFN